METFLFQFDAETCPKALSDVSFVGDRTIQLKLTRFVIQTERCGISCNHKRQLGAPSIINNTDSQKESQSC